MSDKKMGSVISALITLIIFVGVPYMLPQYLPPNIADMASEAGIDLPSFLNQIMVLGGVTAAITLVKGFVDKTGGIYLLASIAQNVSALAFTEVFLGIGNYASLGLTEYTINMDGAVSHITMDLRVFIYLTVGVVCLRIIQSYIKWNEAKVEAAPPGRIPP